jgi:hypothetical protein
MKVEESKILIPACAITTVGGVKAYLHLKDKTFYFTVASLLLFL